MTDFTSLKLSQPIQKALVAEGYATPTPIQRQAIPPALDGKDILGIAQTGTGKTAAFALPILDHLGRVDHPTPRRGARVLVLAPTRELASQIADSFRAYGKFLEKSVFTVFGGVPINKQIKQMDRGVDVLVATPGRLLDLIDRKAMTLRDVEMLVLDEADQMLDLGFIHALRRIIPLLPKKRQSFFFSATMPKTIAELADAYLRDPVKVSVAPAATTVERVEQRVTFVAQNQKQALLTLTLRDPAITRALVFSRTKHGADRIVRGLMGAEIEAAAIHGNKSQPQRERALEAFRSGRCRVLVATDIAARGIDIDGVTHVINFDIPNVAEQYVHRIGRTARAGASGYALSFVSDDERRDLRNIERITRNKIDHAPLPKDFQAAAAALPPPAPKERARPKGGSKRKPQTKPAAKPQAKPGREGAAGARAGKRPFRKRRGKRPTKRAATAV